MCPKPSLYFLFWDRISLSLPKMTLNSRNLHTWASRALMMADLCHQVQLLHAIYFASWHQFYDILSLLPPGFLQWLLRGLFTSSHFPISPYCQANTLIYCTCSLFHFMDCLILIAHFQPSVMYQILIDSVSLGQWS